MVESAPPHLLRLSPPPPDNACWCAAAYGWSSSACVSSREYGSTVTSVSSHDPCEFTCQLPLSGHPPASVKNEEEEEDDDDEEEEEEG